MALIRIAHKLADSEVHWNFYISLGVWRDSGSETVN